MRTWVEPPYPFECSNDATYIIINVNKFIYAECGHIGSFGIVNEKMLVHARTLINGVCACISHDLLLCLLLDKEMLQWKFCRMARHTFSTKHLYKENTRSSSQPLQILKAYPTS